MLLLVVKRAHYNLDFLLSNPADLIFRRDGPGVLSLMSKFLPILPEFQIMTCKLLIQNDYMLLQHTMNDRTIHSGGCAKTCAS